MISFIDNQTLQIFTHKPWGSLQMVQRTAWCGHNGMNRDPNFCASTDLLLPPVISHMCKRGESPVP
jgi:hypothetical protein